MNDFETVSTDNIPKFSILKTIDLVVCTNQGIFKKDITDSKLKLTKAKTTHYVFVIQNFLTQMGEVAQLLC